MAKIKINGDSSGYVEIAAPNAAHNNTLQLGPGTKILTDKNTHTSSIGIGTDNPTNDLVIESSGNGKGLVVRKTSVESAFLGHNGSGNEGLLILREDGTNRIQLYAESGQPSFINSGNVGVGTIAPTGNFEVHGNDGINISNSYRTGTNGVQWRLIPHNGGGSTTNLRLYEGAGATEVINITKTGRIGVNRMTPSFMLDIIGNSSTGANCIRIVDGAETGHGSHPAKIVAGGTYYHEMQMHSRRFTVHTWNGSNIAERFRVHQDGTVTTGGLSSTPGTVAAGSFVQAAANAGFFSNGIDGKFGTSSNHPLYFQTNGVTKATITAAGAFSVGTTSPQQPNLASIHVHSTANDDCRIAITTPNKPDGRIGYFGLSNKFGMDVYNGFEIRDVGASYATRLAIDSSGRVTLNGASTNWAWGGADDLVLGNITSGTRTGITLVSGSDTDGGLYFSDGTSSSNAFIQGQIVYNHSSQDFSFYTSVTKRISIKTNHGSGNAFGPILYGEPGLGLYINGATSNMEADATATFTKQNNNDWALMVRNYEGSSTDYGLYSRSKNTAAYAIAVFDHDNTVWRFRVNGGGTIYATNTTVSSISDQRLKENIVDANSQWDDIKALRFRNFNWREDSGYSDGKTYLGLIAQEVEPISPNLVDINAQTKEDIENEVPDPEYKNVKYSIVWMKAVKALQEAQTRIETLEAEVAALKGS